MTQLAVSVLLVVSSIAPHAQGGPALDFKNSSRAEKILTLNAIAANRITVRPNELKELIGYGLDDVDEQVRRRTLLTLANRFARSRFAATATSARAQDPEREALKLLGPRLATLLGDSNEQVRLAAILAIGNLELEGSGKKLSLGHEFSTVLANLYSGDSSPRVRQEILKTFALVQTTGDRQHVTTAILNGLNETNAASVQYALMAVANQQLTQALPKVAEQLGNSEKRIRIAAAQCLATIGQPARRYLPELQQASQVEQDDITKQTMLGAIKTLTPRQ